MKTLRYLLLTLALLSPSMAWADYESTVSADSPCQWWKMQETSGTTFTSSPVAFGCGAANQTISNSPLLNQSSTGVVGKKSVKFDGLNQYSKYTEGLGGCGLTLHLNWPQASFEAWSLIHANNSNAENCGIIYGSYEPTKGAWIQYMCRDTAASSGFQFGHWGSGGTGAYLIAGSAGGGSAANIVDDTWYYSVVTWADSSSTLKIYVNGLIANTATSVPTNTTDGCGEDMTIATAGVGFGKFNLLNGNIQYVAFYKNQGGANNAILSDVKVLEHYCASSGGCGIMNRSRGQHTKRSVPDVLAFALPWRGSSLFGSIDNTSLSPPAFTKLWDDEMDKDAQPIPTRTHEERLIVRPDSLLASRAAMVSREYRILAGVGQ